MCIFTCSANLHGSANVIKNKSHKIILDKEWFTTGQNKRGAPNMVLSRCARSQVSESSACTAILYLAIKHTSEGTRLQGLHISLTFSESSTIFIDNKAAWKNKIK